MAKRAAQQFREFAVQPRDLGIGRFHVQQSPLGTGPLQGVCIFDATHGSLRLTERLGEHFSKVVRAARHAAEVEATGGLPGNTVSALKVFYLLADSITEKAVGSGASAETASASAPEWLEVIANGETAIYVSDGTAATEVVVLKYFFTPQGLKHQLKHEKPVVRWTVESRFVQPMNGVTKIVLYNPNTDEEKPKP